MQNEKILTVSEFVNELKDVVNNHPSFKNVALVGELSNFKAHHSGHFYFSLKDKDSRIACVMFKSKAVTVQFRPKDGDKVVLHGSLQVFESSGSVQIYADRMNLDGLGDLHIQFEQLKKEYEEKGYFDAVHKKSVPPYPRSIAVIVGENSAAYHDISRTLAERWPQALQIDLLAYVQGENAIKSIVQMLTIAHNKKVDVIILGRGGGSIEDLWAFNERDVVEAVFNATIPVISGIGHESDTTLTDFVADYRAATPTAAAVYATPNRTDMLALIRDYKNQYYIRVRNKLMQEKKQYDYIINTSYLGKPEAIIDKKRQQIDYYQTRITHQVSMFDAIKQALQRFDVESESALMKIFHTHEQLLISGNREFARIMNYKLDNQTRLLQSTNARMENLFGQNLRTLDKNRQVLNDNQVVLVRRVERSINLKKSQFSDIIKTLSNNNPAQKMMQLFDKGFVKIQHDDEPITSIHNIAVDETVTMTLSDGILTAKVTGKEEL
ncbi:exodeoxyribonuclease VII large subunit [Erysipelothrix sp. HDW6C]|nr:exodeoxyribonuclease VII large subunit [Erysipelothrix sp. HDW6C]